MKKSPSAEMGDSDRSGAGGPILSVVIPFFDERQNLRPLVEELLPIMEGTGETFEVLLVDDGSTDGGGDTALERFGHDPRIRVVRLESRQGQSGALAVGFGSARGDSIITMDADLQNDPADIPRLLAAHVDSDVVCGVRRNRRDSWVRRVSSRIANAIRNRLTHESIVDVGCSLRVIRADFLPRVPVFSSMHRFLPTLLRMAGATVSEIPVGHRPRRKGKSKYGIGNRAWRGLVDLFGIRWLQKRRVDVSVAKELTPPRSRTSVLD